MTKWTDIVLASITKTSNSVKPTATARNHSFALCTKAPSQLSLHNLSACWLINAAVLLTCWCTRLRRESRPSGPPSKDPRLRLFSRCQGEETTAQPSGPFKTHTHTHMSNIKTIHRVFLSFFLSAKQPQAKRNRRTIIIGQSDLVESVPLVHGVGEASCTVSVGGAEVLALRHLHLDLQTPAYAYEFLCFFLLFLLCRGLKSWMDGWLISIRYIPVFSSNFIQHCDQLWVSTLSNRKILKPLKKLVFCSILKKKKSQKSSRVVVDIFFLICNSNFKSTWTSAPRKPSLAADKKGRELGK